MKNSKKNKTPVFSKEEEKSLQEWKLPPSSASDVVSGRRGGRFGFLPDWTVNTVEKSIPLSQGYSTFPLFSNHSIRKRLYQTFYGYVHVGMIQVALKPTKLGSNASGTVFLRDKRFLEFRSSVLGMVESSLSDGPIYFSYFPSHCVVMSESSVCFSIDVEIKGDENVTLMYKFHYEVMKMPFMYDMSRHGVDERGETTLYLTNIAQSNRVVARKIRWDEIGVGKGSTAENNLSSSSSADVGHTNIDWKETAEAHVLKADVPGLDKEEVKVEVEDGRVLKISGERREDEDEDEDENTWHRVERSSGKFLRRLRLPENADMDQLTAEMKSGVLTVTVPKKEVLKNSQVKVISISG